VLGDFGSSRKVGWRGELRLQRSLRLCARAAQARRAKLILQQAQLRIALHVAHYHERLTRAYLLPVAHQNLADDAAFLMLDGLAIQLDLNLAARDHCSG
jgi:hypothetical protein